MRVSGWRIGRLSRSVFLFSVIGVNALVTAADLWELDRLNLLTDIGFRFDALRHGASLPAWRSIVEITSNIMLALLATARLHDASYSARWLRAIFLCGALALLPGAGALSVVALMAWAAIFFLPPSIGPNRFGADPRGWKSRAQFHQQRENLAEQRRR